MQPGKFAPPGGEDWIGRKFAELERQFRELAAANVFGTTGITPEDGGTSFDGYVTINGAAKITGTLNLPAGIIGNDALANPLDVDTATAFSRNHGYTSSTAAIKSVQFTVPEGFTEAMVTCQAVAQGLNNTSTGDYLYVEATVENLGSGETYALAGAGLAVSVTAPLYHVLTGLTGGQIITASILVRTNTGTWAPSQSNTATLHAQAIFLR